MEELEKVLLDWRVSASLRPGYLPERIMDVECGASARRQLLMNLRNIQGDLRPLGWRLVRWRECVSGSDISLVNIGEISAQRLPPVYYHVTRKGNVPGIMERGLLPRRNYEEVLNPVPSVFLARSLNIAHSCIPVGSTTEKSVVVLEVSVEGIPLRPDPETIWMFIDDIDVVYSHHRVPPERITVKG